MRTPVHGQVRPVRVAAAADFAGEGLAVAVLPLVCPEGAAVREPPVALVAHVRLLAAVEALVLLGEERGEGGKEEGLETWFLLT